MVPWDTSAPTYEFFRYERSLGPVPRVKIWDMNQSGHSQPRWHSSQPISERKTRKSEPPPRFVSLVRLIVYIAAEAFKSCCFIYFVFNLSHTVIQLIFSYESQKDQCKEQWWEKEIGDIHGIKTWEYRQTWAIL